MESRINGLRSAISANCDSERQLKSIITRNSNIPVSIITESSTVLNTIFYVKNLADAVVEKKKRQGVKRSLEDRNSNEISNRVRREEESNSEDDTESKGATDSSAE